MRKQKAKSAGGVPNYLEKLGERLKTLRKSHGLSQQKLAAKAGFDYRYVGFLEQARINPTIKTLEKVARALSVHVCDLLPDAGEKGKRPDSIKLNERELLQAKIMRNLHKADYKRLKTIEKLVNVTVKIPK
jgi:transcriptional regulator with XRE-family HTH domain